MDDDIVLVNATGDKEVDRVLRLIIGSIEGELPRLFRGYYVLGSHASGTALAASDLDLVFEGRATDDAERQRVNHLLDTCRAATTLDVGIIPLGGDELHGIFNPTFKLRSLFLYGRDIRDTLPLLPVTEWARRCMHGIYRVMGRDGRLTAVTYPLEYPDPHGEFYGYDNKKARLPDGTEVNTTRGLVAGAGWIATALIGLQAQRYVLSKGEFAPLYRQYIDDEWAPFLEDLDDTCRGAWGYLVPDRVEDRQKLRALCQRYLRFENHFVTVYKRFALSEVQGGTDDAALQVLHALQYVPYQDAEMRAAIEALLDCGDERLRCAAQATLRAFSDLSSG